MISKNYKEKEKNLVLNILIIPNEKKNKYVIEYEGKKIHFGSTKYEDYLIHKDIDRREKYLAKAKKQTKMVISLMNFLHIQIIGL